MRFNEGILFLFSFYVSIYAQQIANSDSKALHAFIDNVIQNVQTCICYKCDQTNTSIVKGIVHTHNETRGCYQIVNQRSENGQEMNRTLPAVNNIALLTETLELLRNDHDKYFITNDHKLASGYIYLYPQLITNETLLIRWVSSLPSIFKSNFHLPQDQDIDMNCVLIQMFPQAHLVYNCHVIDEDPNRYRFVLSDKPFDVYDKTNINVFAIKPSAYNNGVSDNIRRTIILILLCLVLIKVSYFD